MIPSQKITKSLSTQVIGKKIFSFDTIDSTNTCARLLAECGTDEGTVVITDFQTSGKGRMNRMWSSAKGKNLLFSIIFSPKFPEKALTLFPLIMSVAMVDGITNYLPTSILKVKWPNDVLLENGKKIAGILTEITKAYNNESRIIVGMGLNVNQTSFPSIIKEKTSSLKVSTGMNINRIELLQKILESIERWYLSYPDNTNRALDTWKNYCIHIGKHIIIQLPDEVKSGLCLDIDPEGALLIENGNKQRVRIFAGDLHLE